MFAVPGWNVSAPIKAQVEAPKAKDPNKLGKKAQKRKQKQQQEQITAENLVEQWEKSLAGKGAEEAKEEEKAEPKPAVKEEKDTEDKRGKKRKREKAEGKKDDEAKVPENKKTEDSSKTTESAEDAAPPTTTADTESKRDKKKRKKENKQQQSKDTPSTTDITTALKPSFLVSEPAGLTPLQKSMRNKLASARFRHLNESLYTKPSAESLDIFKEDPSMFEDYHRGFAQQVEVWPENPVDGYVDAILKRGGVRTKDPWKAKKKGMKGKGGGQAPEPEQEEEARGLKGMSKPLPRNMRGHSTIADLGCGTASLSYRLQPHLKNLNLTLHSFDLSKPAGPSGPLVTVADICNLPLADGTADVAIFCLALMGTNWTDFIDEAYRVLRWRGELWVAEIKSRFGRVDGKAAAAASNTAAGRKVPINSIGSLRKTLPSSMSGGKGDKKDKKKGKKEDDPEGIANSDDEAELAVTVDGASAKSGTDVSSFIEVLRKRGFVLDALPERPNDAIDLSNKMFVKMQFVKSAHPSRGKNAREDQKEGAVVKGGLRMGIKGKKFAAVKEDKDDSGEKDGGVLKPCLYKIR